jgi:hypothetical protein
VDAVQGSSASGPFGLRLPFQIRPKDLRVTFLTTPQYGGDPTKHIICLDCASESPEMCARVGVTVPEPSSSDCGASNHAGTPAPSSPMDSDDQPAEGTTAASEARTAFGAHVRPDPVACSPVVSLAAAGCALAGVQPMLLTNRRSWKSLWIASLNNGRSAT